MTLLLGVCAGLILAVVTIRLFENRLIFLPPRYPEGFSEVQLSSLHVEEIWLTTKDNVRINAWFFANPASPKVLFWLHGNAENIGYGLASLDFYSRLGTNVFALDYRGYGKSEGSPDEAGVYRDADAAYDYLVEVRHFRPESIIIYGHSLGGAVAIDLASRRKCAGLIVESTFTTAREMARRLFRVPLFEYIPKSRFDSLAKIARVDVPVLIAHGARDPVIPCWMGQKLFEAARQPKSLYVLEGATHSDMVEVGGEQYLGQLKTFVVKL